MTNKTDQAVVVIMFLLVLLYGAVWAMGYFTHRLSCSIATLNMATAFAVVGYWAIRQFQIQQHHFELREMIVLGIEVLIFMAAVYTIASGSKYKWVTTMQYLFFGIHLLVLVIGLVFMFTFKINKLI